jgi:hypothetical protein
LRLVGILVGGALTALAIGASVGVVAAHAEGTVLCKVNEEKCAEKNTYPLLTTLEAKLEPATSLTFTTSVYTVQCAKSEQMQLSLQKETTEALIGQLEKWQFIECTSSGKNCANEPWELAWQAAFRSSKVGEGRKEWVTFSKSENGDPKIKIQCVLSGQTSFECFYAAETLEMQIEGGKPAKLLTNGLTLPRVGGSEALCGSSLTWSAKYVLSPEPLFVTQH